MSTLFLGLVLCFLVVITHADTRKKCKSRIVVTQSSNNILPVVFSGSTDDNDGDRGIPSVVSWYIGSYLNGELPTMCSNSPVYGSSSPLPTLQPPAISSASCVLQALSPTITWDLFGNELLDDQFPVVFNCDGTILINQFPDGIKKIDDECYGIITWQGPLGSVDGSTVAITGGSGDYAGVTGQIVISNVIDSADCPCYQGDPPQGIGPPCFKYELFLKDVEGTGKTSKVQMDVMSKLGFSVASIGLAFAVGFGIYQYRKNKNSYEKTAPEESYDPLKNSKHHSSI